MDAGGVVREVREWGVHRVGRLSTLQELEAARAIVAHEVEGLAAFGGPCPLVEGDAQRHTAKVAAGQHGDEEEEARVRWAWFKQAQVGGAS